MRKVPGALCVIPMLSMAASGVALTPFTAQAGKQYQLIFR
jgi:hypothetical protein